ncbi:DMT family transporter [Aromatoleum toluclasticum]|uniref:DMT family transporter n=1 Tax=Aromatoleum toluclasticum TaxID=92003 RepID=UPI001D192E30|nr:DMT family transporter [Aromatoleum toluclasticum]MCC4117476.1 DMT family transporter [Aromatoleum toluclasticum]
MSRASHRTALLFATLGAIGFSFKAIFVKLAYRYGVDAETLLALRMGLSLPFFIVMGLVADARAAQRMDGRDWLWMVALGFSGYYLSSYLDFLGLRYITAALERLILFLYPTLVILLSALFLAKPIGRRTLAALALCYCGIGLAVGHDLHIAGEARDVALGGALVFASSLSYALYLMGNGQVVGRLGSMRVTAFATSVASVLCIAQFFVLRPVSALDLPWQVYALGVAMALMSTVAPVWLVSEAIRRLGAGPVSLMGTLGPVVTILLGWLLLDEALGISQLAGASLVIAGVLVMARR